MESKKKKSRWFFRILFLLFIIYMGLYVALQTGYYQTKASENVFYTKEQIEKFEQDIKDGKPVDINSYIIEKENYDNKITDFSMSVTKTIESVFNTCVKKVFNIVSILIG